MTLFVKSSCWAFEIQTRYDRISAIEFKLVQNETNKYSRTKSWRSRGIDKHKNILGG